MEKFGCRPKKKSEDIFSFRYSWENLVSEWWRDLGKWFLIINIFLIINMHYLMISWLLFSMIFTFFFLKTMTDFWSCNPKIRDSMVKIHIYRDPVVMILDNWWFRGYDLTKNHDLKILDHQIPRFEGYDPANSMILRTFEFWQWALNCGYNTFEITIIM